MMWLLPQTILWRLPITKIFCLRNIGNILEALTDIFYDGDDQIYIEDWSYQDVDAEALPFVRIPIHLGSDDYSMDGTESFVWIDKQTSSGTQDCGIFKQDVYLKRVRHWFDETNTPLASVEGIALSLIDPTYTYELSDNFGGVRWFNNAIFFKSCE